MKLLHILAIFCLSISLYGMEKKHTPENTNIAVVTDGLVSHWGGAPKKEEYVKFLGGFSFSKARAIGTALSLIPKYKEIKQKGREIQAETDGVANIIHELIRQLKQDGYDISELQEDLNRLSINYKPEPKGIQTVQNIRAQGFKTIAVTGQDSAQFKICREKLAQQGIDLSRLFDNALCHAAYNSSQRANKTTENYYQLDDGTIASKAPIYQSGFFKTLKEVSAGKKTVLCYKDSEDKRKTFESLAQNNLFSTIKVSSAEQLSNALDAKLAEPQSGWTQLAVNVKSKGLQGFKF